MATCSTPGCNLPVCWLVIPKRYGVRCADHKAIHNKRNAISTMNRKVEMEKVRALALQVPTLLEQVAQLQKLNEQLKATVRKIKTKLKH